jgi:hypothetical protein
MAKSQNLHVEWALIAPFDKEADRLDRNERVLGKEITIKPL